MILTFLQTTVDWIMTSCSTWQWLTWYNMQCLCHVSSFCANNSTVIALMVPLNYTCVTAYRADTCKMLIFISNTSRKLVLIGIWKASVWNYVKSCFVFNCNETMHDISDDDTIGCGGNIYNVFLQTTKLSVVVDKTKRVTCAAPVAACIMLSCELQANLKVFTNRRRRSGVMNRCN